jgi:hypothetical protein
MTIRISDGSVFGGLLSSASIAYLFFFFSSITRDKYLDLRVTNTFFLQGSSFHSLLQILEASPNSSFSRQGCLPCITNNINLLFHSKFQVDLS